MLRTIQRLEPYHWLPCLAEIGLFQHLRIMGLRSGETAFEIFPPTQTIPSLVADDDRGSVHFCGGWSIVAGVSAEFAGTGSDGPSFAGDRDEMAAMV